MAMVTVTIKVNLQRIRMDLQEKGNVQYSRTQVSGYSSSYVIKGQPLCQDFFIYWTTSMTDCAGASVPMTTVSNYNHYAATELLGSTA